MKVKMKSINTQELGLFNARNIAELILYITVKNNNTHTSIALIKIN